MSVTLTGVTADQPARPNKTPPVLRSVAQHVVHADGEPEGRPTLNVHPIDRQVSAGPALARDRKTSSRAQVRAGGAGAANRGSRHVETGYHPGCYCSGTATGAALEHHADREVDDR